MHGSGAARDLFARSAPRNRNVHLISSEDRHQLFLVDGSRIFALDAATAAAFATAMSSPDSDALQRRLDEARLAAPPFIDDEPPAELRIRALSLAVAQKCNLGCSYCYARGGDFGGVPKAMDGATAKHAIDLLLSEAVAGERVNLAFLGGEPLANRSVVHEATRYAAARARERGIVLTFSITTNGTLVSARDIDLFAGHRFAVTVSLDGDKNDHDRLRPYKSGRGSFERIMANIAPALARQRGMQVSARVTVTPRNLALRSTLDAFVALGFHSVGFSPMLSAPDTRDDMEHDDLARMLDEMVACGMEFERRTIAGERYPFANLLNALKEIHKGTHRPYPCGAGAGYFGVSADGDLSACHRFVGDEAGAMGSLSTGVDRTRQRNWLASRHVHHQEPCNGCWARYLCGGGCHHEVIHRGRPACDFIRGWLHYCISAYGRLLSARPELFGRSAAAAVGRSDAMS